MQKRVLFWGTFRGRRESLLSYPTYFLGRVGTPLGRLEVSSEPLGSSGDFLESMVGRLGADCVQALVGLLWGIFGSSGGALRGILKAYLVSIGGLFGALLGPLEFSWGPPWLSQSVRGPTDAFGGRFGCLRAQSGGFLGASSGCPRSFLGSSWEPLGPSWGDSAPSLGPLGGFLGRLKSNTGDHVSRL